MNVQVFDFAVDLLRAQLWQYDGRPALTTLMRGESDWYQKSYSEFWQDWYRDVFDLRTANEFGCTVWARILGISLSVTVPPTPVDVPVWGFGEDNENFENGNFAVMQQEEQNLPIEMKRLLLMGRYMALTSNFSIPSVNFAVKLAFAQYGPAYVLDGEDMTVTVVLGFSPPAFLTYALDRFEIIPHPAAVGVRFVVNPLPAWGFGDENENFENGNFAPYVERG